MSRRRGAWRRRAWKKQVWRSGMVATRAWVTRGVRPRREVSWERHRARPWAAAPAQQEKRKRKDTAKTIKLIVRVAAGFGAAAEAVRGGRVISLLAMLTPPELLCTAVGPLRACQMAVGFGVAG